MAERRPSKKAKTRSARRIAVILGASGSSQLLLDRLLPLLGNGRNIEMQAVFLEEAAVQHAAELPFVQELCRVTFSVREFNSDRFEKALVLRMRTAQRALDLLARRTGVRHSFRNVRGSAVNLLREAAESSDMAVFEPVRRYGVPLGGSSPRTLARQHIVVVVSDPDSTPAVLRAAAHLASGRTHSISIVLFPAVAEAIPELRDQVATFLQGRVGQLRFIAPGNIDGLLAAVRELRAGMLILPAHPCLVEVAALGRILDHLRCPVCLVRKWRETSVKPG